MSLFNLRSRAPATLGPAHLRLGHLSTIVSPGAQSQVREGGSCHDPRPTDGGHGNPFSFSGKWAGPAQARGLHTENTEPGPQLAHGMCLVEPRRLPFSGQHQGDASFSEAHGGILVPTRVLSIALHSFPTHPQGGLWQCGVRWLRPLVLSVL